MDITADSNWGFTGMPSRAYYELKLYVPDEEQELRAKYEEARDAHNAQVLPSISGHPDEFDAGFDLFIPRACVSVESGQTCKIDHKVRCSMQKVEHGTQVRVGVKHGNLSIAPPPGSAFPVGYYLYPRSSTGTKTPLRLANSVGIIDSGYRGNIIAAFDNRSDDTFSLGKFQRVVQLCPPDLTYPLYVVLVDSAEELGITTRADGGFGSTGN